MSRMPVVVFSEEQQRAAVEEIVGWIDRVEAKMRSEASHHAVRNQIKKMLQDGRLSHMRAIELAREYWEVDRALREHIFDMPDRGEYVPPSLIQHAALAATPRDGGRDMVDNFRRDLGICVLVFLTHRHFGVPPTRNGASRRGDRSPSACSLVAKALSRGNRFPLAEKTVQDNIWNGLGTLATRLEAAIPL
jgi:hypothetical protein